MALIHRTGETAKWLDRRGFTRKYKIDSETHITHTYNRECCLMIPDDDLHTFYHKMEADYRQGIGQYISESVEDPLSSNPKVNIFCDLDASDEDCDWTAEYQLTIAQNFAFTVKQFCRTAESANGVYVYVSGKRDPDTLTKFYPSLHLQTNKCVSAELLSHILAYFTRRMQGVDDRNGKKRPWTEIIDTQVCKKRTRI